MCKLLARLFSLYSKLLFLCVRSASLVALFDVHRFWAFLVVAFVRPRLFLRESLEDRGKDAWRLTGARSTNLYVEKCGK